MLYATIDDPVADAGDHSTQDARLHLSLHEDRLAGSTFERLFDKVELYVIHLHCRGHFRPGLVLVIQHQLFEFTRNILHEIDQFTLDDQQGEVERRRQHLGRQRLTYSCLFALHRNLRFA